MATSKKALAVLLSVLLAWCMTPLPAFEPDVAHADTVSTNSYAVVEPSTGAVTITDQVLAPSSNVVEYSGVPLSSVLSNPGSPIKPSAVTSVTIAPTSGTKILLPGISAGYFEGFSNCKSINGLNNFDASQAGDMNRMFMGCSSLKKLDLSSFNLRYATSMLKMFANCTSLESVLLPSNANSGQLANTNEMFIGCKSLAFIDLSGLNTQNVTTMWGMFANCESLAKINLGGQFNTSSCQNMWMMFENCSSLKSLDLGAFATNSCTNMSNMFYGCTSLETLDIGGFSTFNCAQMGNMFYGCGSLSSVTLGQGFSFYGNGNTYASLPDGVWRNGSGCAFTAANVPSFTQGTYTLMANGAPITAANLDRDSYTYNGRAKQPGVSVYSMDYKLTPGTDYTVEYVDNVYVGEAYAIVRGTGLYSGSKTLSFRINQAPVRKVEVYVKRAYYTGHRVRPRPIVRYNNRRLVWNRDYRVTYRNNWRVGWGRMTIRGIGNFRGRYTVRFRIYPHRVSFRWFRPYRYGFEMRWHRSDWRNADGYQIRWSWHRDMRFAHHWFVRDWRRDYHGIWWRQPHRRYFVQIRAFKFDRWGHRWYSPWSEQRMYRWHWR